MSEGSAALTLVTSLSRLVLRPAVLFFAFQFLQFRHRLLRALRPFQYLSQCPLRFSVAFLSLDEVVNEGLCH